MSGTARALIAAAGTGGHVLPGLAVARALRARGWEVAWVGTTGGREREWVRAEGIEFEAVRFSSIRGKGPLQLALGPVRALLALWQCWRVLRRRSPRVLFTTGGYIAVPAGLAAVLSGVRLAFLNADAGPQLSLRILRPWVDLVLCGFEGAAARLAGPRSRLTGTPVREDICALAPPEERFAGASGPLRLLVLGGSLGARALNGAVPAALALIEPGSRPRVVHQCGAGHEESTRAAYARAGVEAEVSPFLADMASRYAQADLVVCRAGAVTVSELCAAGLASILVPFVASTTDHQLGNARMLERRQAAIVIEPGRLEAAALAQLLRGLTRSELLQMACHARAQARPGATGDIVRELALLGEGG